MSARKPSHEKNTGRKASPALAFSSNPFIRQIRLAMSAPAKARVGVLDLSEAQAWMRARGFMKGGGS
ncbi:hypothetical protein [Paucibacter sp. Y2R2-4]|uniref:hypothetical protein n=1 Tax=Paucibacter sp. Y2R2-4 TaxID=2893553 RepID=UPI0021E4537F|nr:hypothetical protein [Paucibacter sp. Y2R2-4]MCV2348707.1 hypothetical protein [Paucibacter sp. Y2R2-4]